MAKDSSETARRGRPPRTEQQADASRARVIRAARDLFAKEGYDGVSMRKIAAKAACQPSMLYALFPNKRSLLHVLWASIFVDLFGVLERVFAQDSGAERVSALCLTVIDFWLARPDDYRAIFLVEDRIDESADDYFAQSPLALAHIDLFRQAVAQAQAAGDFGPGDPAEIADVLLCSVNGVAYGLIGVPEYGWTNRDNLSAITVRTLINGLR